MTDTVSEGPTSGDNGIRYLQSIFSQFRLQRCHFPVPFMTHTASGKVCVAASRPDGACVEGVRSNLGPREGDSYVLCDEGSRVETVVWRGIGVAAVEGTGLWGGITLVWVVRLAG